MIDITSLLNEPNHLLLVLVLMLMLLTLGLSLIALLFERQAHQKLQMHLHEISAQLLAQQEDTHKLEKLHFLGAQRQQHMDKILQDLYTLLESISRQVQVIKNKPTVNPNVTSEMPEQGNYEQAIRMAKQGLSGKRIQSICDLNEEEVNLILDLHRKS